jgi:hypothetical protein
LKDSDHAGFIANGDIIEVLEIFNIKELYGFKFANVKIRWLIIQIKSLWNCFIIGHDKSESPSLTYEESNRLYQEVLKDYEGETKFKQFQKSKSQWIF